MSFKVEMVFGKPGTSRFRTFSCSGLAWASLLELGSVFGWVPAGTMPGEGIAEPGMLPNRFHSNYRPDDWTNCKRVTEDDAEALAHALELAIDAMQAKDCNGIEHARRREGLGDAGDGMRLISLPRELIEDFISFLRNGEFLFASDRAEISRRRVN